MTIVMDRIVTEAIIVVGDMAMGTMAEVIQIRDTEVRATVMLDIVITAIEMATIVHTIRTIWGTETGVMAVRDIVIVVMVIVAMGTEVMVMVDIIMVAMEMVTIEVVATETPTTATGEGATEIMAMATMGTVIVVIEVAMEIVASIVATATAVTVVTAGIIVVVITMEDMRMEQITLQLGTQLGIAKIIMVWQDLKNPVRTAI